MGSAVLWLREEQKSEEGRAVFPDFFLRVLNGQTTVNASRRRPLCARAARECHHPPPWAGELWRRVDILRTLDMIDNIQPNDKRLKQVCNRAAHR